MWDLIVSVPDHCLSFTYEHRDVHVMLGKGLFYVIYKTKYF